MKYPAVLCCSTVLFLCLEKYSTFANTHQDHDVVVDTSQEEKGIHEVNISEKHLSKEKENAPINHSGNHTGNQFQSHGVHVASLHFDYVRKPLIISLFLIIASICKLGFHHANFLSTVVPESCLLIILGTVVGAVLHDAAIDKSEFMNFSSQLFFLNLLPPIILESAYSLHDRVFADNIGTILLYAVLGTILNCFAIGVILYGLAEYGLMGHILPLTLVQCLVFSSLIVAVDPVAVLAIFQEIGVNNVLYFLVFGESLLNDAVTVVLYNMMTAFNSMESIPQSQIVLGFVAFFTVSLGGLAIGLVYGTLSALLTKLTNAVRVVEPLTIFTLAYLSYLTAELFHFSGIISIIACGLMQAQYAFHNISHNSHTTVKYFSKMMSATSDCVIFMFLGLALVRDDHVWHTGFILWSIVTCLVIRFLVVYFLTFLVNKLNRLRQIDMEEQFIMAYGGLRGAVAFSLVAMLESSELPSQPLFQTATLAVIIFTVFVQGITIKPLVNLLRIKKSENKVVSMYEEINYHVTDHVMAGVEEIIGYRGKNFLRETLDYYDDNYLKYWLQKNPIRKDDQIMALYNKIAMQQHYENLAGLQPIETFYGSEMNLYICPLGAQNDFLEVVDDQEMMEYALDVQRNKSISSMGTVYTSRSRGSIIPTLFKFRMAEDGSTEWERRISDTKLGGRNVVRKLSQDSGDADVEDEGDISAKDVKKWIVKPQNYHRRYDRNLTHENDLDLLHHLYEKQLRTARMRRASVALSPASSMSSSPTGLHSIDEDNVFTCTAPVKKRMQPRMSRAYSENPHSHVSKSRKYVRQSWPKHHQNLRNSNRTVAESNRKSYTNGMSQGISQMDKEIPVLQDDSGMNSQTPKSSMTDLVVSNGNQVENKATATELLCSPGGNAVTPGGRRKLCRQSRSTTPPPSDEDSVVIHMKNMPDNEKDC